MKSGALIAVSIFSMCAFVFQLFYMMAYYAHVDPPPSFIIWLGIWITLSIGSGALANIVDD